MKPAEVTMPSETEVAVTRSFDAPVELVWKAFTEPELVRRWMLGPPGWTMPVCEMDFRVGGAFRWQWRSDEGNQEFGFVGEFQLIEPNAKIVHTERFQSGNVGVSMARETLVTVTFREANGITTVVTSIAYSFKEDRDAALSTGMTDGMEMSYRLLDEVLAG